MATSKHRPILRMEQLATGGKFEQNLSVVDLLDRKEFSRKPYISNTLIAAMEKHLRGGEQILLFLNRRGTARLVFCDECGWQALCPRCDIALVYHGDQHKMRCHICQFVTPSPSSCPICHNTSVVFRSIGTKAIVDDITDIFPDAKIIRFDTDNKKSETLEQNYKLVHDKGVDIIIGTQTLAKGLDLPGLGLVGVIVADTGLYFPDYSAQERTYQLLSQVLGRVARGHRASEAIIQTYTPDSPLLQSVIAKKWQLFYETELRERQKFMFPPYCHLLKLVCRRASQESAAQTAEKLVEKLASSGLHIVVEGPAPAFHAKIMDKYQWQVVVKSKNRDELLKVIDNLPSGWSYDIDPMDLL